MRHTLKAFFLVAALSAHAAPSTAPATKPADNVSSDGVEYGNVLPTKFKPERFQAGGTSLNEPTHALCGSRQVLSMRNSREKIQQLFQRHNIDLPLNGELACDFYFISSGSSAVTGFNCSNGRVTKVVLFNSRELDESEAALIRDRIASLAKKASYRIDYSVSGHIIELAVDPVDVFLDQHDVPLSTADAMRHHQLAVGMTEAMARAALSKYDARIDSTSADNVHISWVGFPPSRGGSYSSMTSYLDSVQASTSARKVTVWAATFSNGVISNVENYSGQ